MNTLRQRGDNTLAHESVGVLARWPTIITVTAWPAVIVSYSRLARREEREAEARFSEAYRVYPARVPMFAPRLGPRVRILWGER